MEDRSAGAGDLHRRADRSFAFGTALIIHPAFAPYAGCLELASGGLAALNEAATLRQMARHQGIPIRFVAAPARRSSALDYETRIATCGEIETRDDDPHDLANAFVWLVFPRTKAALNAVHARDGRATSANARSRARDAATLIDESGLLFACANRELVALLRARRWRELFATRRDEVAADVRAVAVGHGLLVKLRAPYRALTAHALIVDPAIDSRDDSAIDRAAAQLIGSPGFAPETLVPLPVAALPGWDTEGLGRALFDDVSVFRTAVLG